MFKNRNGGASGDKEIKVELKKWGPRWTGRCEVQCKQSCQKVVIQTTKRKQIHVLFLVLKIRIDWHNSLSSQNTPRNSFLFLFIYNSSQLKCEWLIRINKPQKATGLRSEIKSGNKTLIYVQVFHNTAVYSGSEFPVRIWVGRGKCSHRHQVKNGEIIIWKYFSLFKKLLLSFQKFHFIELNKRKHEWKIDPR